MSRASDDSLRSDPREGSTLLPPPPAYAPPHGASDRAPATRDDGSPDRAPHEQDAGRQPEHLPSISIVAPVFNEVETVDRLVEAVVRVFDGRRPFELVLVDDGSTDGGDEKIRAASERDPRVRGVYLRENRGQSAALCTGFVHARGAIVATLDADLQCDPADLPAMLERLEATGADAVVGFRAQRRDTLARRLSSRLANWLRNRVLPDRLRDTCCPLRVVRRRALQAIPAFDGMHRFLPTLLRCYGYEVIEHEVRHHPRTEGRSKYGIRDRALRGVVDLFAVRWLRARVVRPVVVERSGVGLEADDAAPRR